MFELYRNFELDGNVFLNGETKGNLYELCDNSSYNCSSFAEFTVYELVDFVYMPPRISMLDSTNHLFSTSA